jgi:GDP-L-fucose synthase
MRFLITGASGFIGRHLALRLMQREDAVVVIPRHVDLRHTDETLRAFDAAPVDYILHLADKDGDAHWSGANAFDQFHDNMCIHTNVLSAWRLKQPSARFVGFGSAWAYPCDDLRLFSWDEADYWEGAMHPTVAHYGLTKKMLGMGIQAAWNQFGMYGTMLVLGNVYGPGDASSHVIPSLLRKMYEGGKRLEIHSSGEETRQFIYVDDQIESILTHMHVSEPLLNISSGIEVSLKEVIDLLVQITGYKGEVIYQGDSDGPMLRRDLSIDRATKISGWPKGHTFVSLEEGLRRTAIAYHSEWIKGLTKSKEAY